MDWDDDNPAAGAQQRPWGVLALGPDGTQAPVDLGGRPLRTRRRAPNGRALAGAFFVTAAAVIVLTGWLLITRPSGQSWVVARVAVPAGARLTAADLSSATVRLPAAQAATAFSNPASLVGRITAGRLERGSLVEQGSLVPAGSQPRLRPLAVTDTAADLDALTIGGPVDVLETEGTGTAAVTTVVLRDATLVSVDRSNSTFATSSSSAVAVIGVSSLAEVEAVVDAEHAGTVTLVAGRASDGTGPGAGP